MTEVKKKQRVVIVGGGFGGIRAVLALARHSDQFEITLISDQSHFEYHAALYRVVTGRSALEVCIPLSTIFEGKGVNLIEDKIEAVNPKTKQIVGRDGSKYRYDSLILALGSQNTFLNIPGLREHSFTLKSIDDALRLKRHFHDIFIEAAKAFQKGQHRPIHLVLVGGGSTGVELAGELITYARHTARHHQLDPNTVIVDLFEASDRLLGTLDKKVSTLAYNRLHRLGVNIFLNTPILENRLEAVYLADLKLKTKTLIWTAGVVTNGLYAKIQGLEFSKNGRVMVDLSLQAKGVKDLYVIGDAAASQYSGMAQTANYDGMFVAEGLWRKLNHQPSALYQPKPPIFAIPIGSGWATVVTRFGIINGRLGWLLRRWADLRFFLTILSPTKALLAFRDGARISETCPTCSELDKNTPLPIRLDH